MTLQLDEIKEVIEEYNELPSGFTKYSKVYLTTTENISGILENVTVKDKDVLCVGGSGDQMLNAYLNGAQKITTFDINPITYALINLKVNANIKLKHEEFATFFIPESKYNIGDALNYNTFNKLASSLDEDVASYYDFLYSKYSKEEIFKKTVYPFYPTLKILKRFSNYMNEEDYYKLAHIMQDKEIEFIEADIINLKEQLTDLYDVMLFSNISDSLEYIWTNDTLKSYKSFIHSLGKHYLNADGIIQCGYIYNNYLKNWINPVFAKNTKRQTVFPADEFNEIKIRGFQSFSGTDKIVTYQKKRREA